MNTAHYQNSHYAGTGWFQLIAEPYLFNQCTENSIALEVSRALALKTAHNCPSTQLQSCDPNHTQSLTSFHYSHLLDNDCPYGLRKKNIECQKWDWHEAESICCRYATLGYVMSDMLGLNSRATNDEYTHHETFILSCHFRLCPWEIGYAWAKLVGKGEWAGATKGWKQHGCVWALEWSWLALAWLLLSSYVQIGLDISLGSPFSNIKVQDKQLLAKVLTIETPLTSEIFTG